MSFDTMPGDVFWWNPLELNQSLLFFRQACAPATPEFPHQDLQAHHPTWFFQFLAESDGIEPSTKNGREGLANLS